MFLIRTLNGSIELETNDFLKKELGKLKDETLNQLYNCYKENKHHFKVV